MKNRKLNIRHKILINSSKRILFHDKNWNKAKELINNKEVSPKYIKKILLQKAHNACGIFSEAVQEVYLLMFKYTHEEELDDVFEELSFALFYRLCLYKARSDEQSKFDEIHKYWKVGFTLQAKQKEVIYIFIETQSVP